MSKITDYAFLFQKSFGTSGVNAIGSFQLSQLNSSSVQSKLKAAGINTNSKQYKAAVKQMMSAGNGAMYGNIQGIKNLMSHYDKDGDYINSVNGLAGLLVTDENENSRKRIISIPDSIKEEMYELTKKSSCVKTVSTMGIQQNAQTYITICIAKCPKRTGWLPGTPLKNMREFTDRLFMMPQIRLILTGKLVSQSKLEHLMMLQERLQRQENPLHRQHLILKSKAYKLFFLRNKGNQLY